MMRQSQYATRFQACQTAIRFPQRPPIRIQGEIIVEENVVLGSKLPAKTYAKQYQKIFHQGNLRNPACYSASRQAKCKMKKARCKMKKERFCEQLHSLLLLPPLLPSPSLLVIGRYMKIVHLQFHRTVK